MRAAPFILLFCGSAALADTDSGGWADTDTDAGDTSDTDGDTDADTDADTAAIDDDPAVGDGQTTGDLLGEEGGPACSTTSGGPLSAIALLAVAAAMVRRRR
jgi:uncharacterized protein (TIGR03382 family)